ncbi:hypothetical protein [Nonomuraea sp. NPDC005501]|uniref:hypothetical protein n=1 Tax=unclassified Nonomuraea TaxID=2593643 RepID=UPI0033A912D2
MFVSIVAWDLSRSTATVESLRDYLRDYAVDAYATLEGMRLKAWFSNPDRQTWGAVYLWDSAEAMDGFARVSRVVELIGYPPTSVSVFRLEAIAEGISAYPSLTGLGAAMEGDHSTAG